MTFAAGNADAIGYLVLAHLFVANISGNTVQAGIALSHGDWRDAFLRGFTVPMLAIAAFAGALLPFRARGTPLLLESLLLAVFIFSGHRAHLADPSVAIGYGTVVGFGALLVFAVGIQNATLTTDDGGLRGTTFVTGVVANIGDFAAQYLQMRSGDPAKAKERAAKAQRYLLMFAGYLAGGVAGALLYLQWSIDALWVTVLIVLVAAGIVYRHPQAES